MSASLAAVTLCNAIVPLLPSFCTEEIHTRKLNTLEQQAMVQTPSRTIARCVSQHVMTHQTRNFSLALLISSLTPRMMIDFICLQVLCGMPSFVTLLVVTCALFGRKWVMPKLPKPSTHSWMASTLSLVVTLIPRCNGAPLELEWRISHNFYLCAFQGSLVTQVLSVLERCCMTHHSTWHEKVVPSQHICELWTFNFVVVIILTGMFLRFSDSLL